MPDIKKTAPWDKHYRNKKSVLTYPDENLVRMLMHYLEEHMPNELTALDLGCGSGRHLKLLSDMNIINITGLDNSFNALEISKIYAPVIQADNKALPFKRDSYDLAISWGSLHYCDKDTMKKQLKEMHRVLKQGGVLFGTLRSERDSHIKRGRHTGNNTWVTDLNDIKGSVVSFYSEFELKSEFNIFDNFEYGLIERTIAGDMNKKISHWIFSAAK